MSGPAVLRFKDLYSEPDRRGRYPMSRATLTSLVRKGKFPAPIVLGAGTLIWTAQALDTFDAALAECQQGGALAAAERAAKVAA